MLFYVGLGFHFDGCLFDARLLPNLFGEPKLEPKILKSIKEAPAIMLIPVSILALLAIGGGSLVCLWPHAHFRNRFC